MHSTKSPGQPASQHDLRDGAHNPIAMTTLMDCFVCLKMIRVEQVRAVLKDVVARLSL
jgi:hypothetical protein